MLLSFSYPSRSHGLCEPFYSKVCNRIKGSPSFVWLPSCSRPSVSCECKSLGKSETSLASHPFVSYPFPFKRTLVCKSLYSTKGFVPQRFESHTYLCSKAAFIPFVQIAQSVFFPLCALRAWLCVAKLHSSPSCKLHKVSSFRFAHFVLVMSLRDSLRVCLCVFLTIKIVLRAFCICFACYVSRRLRCGFGA